MCKNMKSGAWHGDNVWYLIVVLLLFANIQVGSHHAWFSYKIFPVAFKVLFSLDLGVFYPVLHKKNGIK